VIIVTVIRGVTASCKNPHLTDADFVYEKRKEEHLYSALHGKQITLKRSGIDHTV